MNLVIIIMMMMMMMMMIENTFTFSAKKFTQLISQNVSIVFFFFVLSIPIYIFVRLPLYLLDIVLKIMCFKSILIFKRIDYIRFNKILQKIFFLCSNIIYLQKSYQRLPKRQCNVYLIFKIRIRPP